MYEALPGSAPENEDGLMKVKVEDPAWEQVYRTQESSCHSQELCRLRFRQFCYQEAPSPREAMAQLRELCHQWLRPEIHTKEQILELLVLEQFLSILPEELQAWMQMCPLQSGEEAVTMLENLATGCGDMGQQASFYVQGQNMHLVVADCQGTFLESQHLQLLPDGTPLKCEPPHLPQEVSEFASQGPAFLQEESSRHKAAVPNFHPTRFQVMKTRGEMAAALAPEGWSHLGLAKRNLDEEVVTKDGLTNVNQDTSKEMEQSGKTSAIHNREIWLQDERREIVHLTCLVVLPPPLKGQCLT